eukprot:TRINITY_DN5935_c0_g1_i1.p1 TRINITY_DN5935_c0_g1~~TRINITY_DN5935_c0_g1_i1.p1  ORF type:complete len:907 (+),score=157.49 TRINITY_DN5935_c0_g1_i1:295-3015(+)
MHTTVGPYTPNIDVGMSVGVGSHSSGGASRKLHASRRGTTGSPTATLTIKSSSFTHSHSPISNSTTSTTTTSTPHSSSGDQPQSSSPSGGSCKECALRGAVVFSHFCEQHRTSVVMCTVQTVPSTPHHNSSHHSHTHQHTASSFANPPNGTYSNYSSYNSPDSPLRIASQPVGPTYFERLPGLTTETTKSLPTSPTRLTTLRLDPSSPFASSPIGAIGGGGGQSTAGCSACNIVAQDNGFLSLDESNSGESTFFITTRYPSSLYSRIRTACVRSLSCEFYPGREGAFLFGDPENGYTLAYVFKLADLQARGGYRWYGLLFFHHYCHLAQHWDNVLSKFRKVIWELQSRAQIQFDKEQLTLQQRNNNNNNTNSTNTTSASTTTNLMPSSTDRLGPGPGVLRRRQARSSASALQSLPKLLGIEDLGKLLHKKFTDVLASCTRSANLYRLPYFPHIPAVPFGKPINVDINRGALVARGGVGVGSYSHRDQQTQTNSSFGDFVADESSCFARSPEEEEAGSEEAEETFRELSAVVSGGEESVSAITSNTATSTTASTNDTSSMLNTTTTTSHNENDLEVFSGHKQVLHALGVEPIMRVLDHLVSGNQIIVRGRSRRLVESLLHLLADFLPAGCVQMRRYESTYYDAYQSNLLGLSPSVVLPDYLDPAMFALIEIEGGILGLPEAWTSYKYTCSAAPLPSLPPLTIIYMNILRLHLHPVVISRLIANQRDEWLAKARAFYAMRRVALSTATQTTPLPLTTTTKTAKTKKNTKKRTQQATTNTSNIHDTHTNTHNTTHNNIQQLTGGSEEVMEQRLLQVLRVTKEDLLSIRFFGTAISAQMRPLLSRAVASAPATLPQQPPAPPHTKQQPQQRQQPTFARPSASTTTTTTATTTQQQQKKHIKIPGMGIALH